MSVAVPPRSEIDEKYTWNAPSVYPSREAWSQEAEAIVAAIPSLQAFEGQLNQPGRLADWLETNASLQIRVYKLYMYASISTSVDSNDQGAAALEGQAGGVFGRYAAASAFAEPEILQIGLDTLRQWTQQEPRLKIYAQYFDDLFRQQAHVRSAEVEELLGMVSEPFGNTINTFEVLVNAELPFPPAIGKDGTEHVISQGVMPALMENPDREVRRTAWENYSDTYLKFKGTLANNYLTSVKQDVFRARARRYQTALEASLFANNIPAEVFHNLIDTYRKNLPLWHRYWEIRRRALKVDKVYPYDVWAPLTDRKPKVAYEQGVDYIAAGLRPLGDEYVNVLRRGCLEERWVDIYPNQGKRQGAFSSGVPGTHPFIMMSYTNELQSVSTLAHELGHSMHSYLTWQNQPAVYSGYSLFVAEVASNFNQAMVRAHLFETNDDPYFQISVIEEAMYNFHRYFFTMPTLARFELEAHTRVEQGKGVTADDLIALMADLFGEGYGSTMDFDRERVGMTWAMYGHLYSNYYVYQYATGISGANALAHKVLTEGQPAAAAYLNFLKAGSSVYPLDALKIAGVDLSTPEPVERTYAILGGFVDRLEKLIEKI